MVATSRTTVPFGSAVHLEVPQESAQVVIMIERMALTGALLSVQEGGGTRSLCIGTMPQTVAYVDAKGQPLLNMVEEWAQSIVMFTIAYLLRASNVQSGDGLLCDTNNVHSSEGQPAPPRVLMVGLGGGVIARALLGLNDRLTLHAIELEQEVISAATTYFGLELGERCTVDVGDALEYLERNAGCESFDVVVVDCFTADGVAPTVADCSMLLHVPRILKPQGLCVVNLHAPSGDWCAAGVVLEVLDRRFDHVYTLDVRTSQNVLALCHDGAVLDAAVWRRLLHDTAALPLASTVCGDVSSTAGLEVCLGRLSTWMGRDAEQLEEAIR